MTVKPWILVVALTYAMGVSAQEGDDIDPFEESWGHLEKGKSGFQETWVHPDADFSKYDSLYLWSAEFQYRDVGPARRTQSTMMNTRQREFGISEEDRELFEDAVADAFVKEVQKAKNFRVSAELGPNTLIMRGAVLDVVSLVPPRTAGRTDVYLASFGEATLVLELIDAENGEVVAVVAERRQIRSGSGRVDQYSSPANRATVIGEVRRWAARAARKLRGELDKALANR